MTDRELMGQALDVLEDIFGKNKIDVGVINRLRDRLAQPEQGPVAWLVQYPNKHEFVWGERPQWIAGAIGIEPLYTAPRQWQELTNEELNQIYAEPQTHAGQYARAIEAKLKEKNT